MCLQRGERVSIDRVRSITPPAVKRNLMLEFSKMLKSQRRYNRDDTTLRFLFRIL